MTHRRQRNPALYLVLAASAMRMAAQAPATSELPSFDAASIKAGSPDVPHMVGVRILAGGRVQIDGFSLKDLVSTAFDMGFSQVSGGDEWMSKNIYFVEATPPDALRSSIKSIRHTLFGDR